MRKGKVLSVIMPLAIVLVSCGTVSASGGSDYTDTPWEGGSGNSSSTASSSTVSKNVTSLEIVNQPDKVDYVEGERFDSNGLIVTAHYDDGSAANVYDYGYDENHVLKVTDTSITVSYLGETVDVAITVHALQKFEAENYSSQSGELAVRAEAAAAGTYSGTGYLGAWDAKAGRWVEFAIDSDRDATAAFYCCLDVPEASIRDWNSRFSVLLNGEEWDAYNDAVYAVSSPAWFQWLNVNLGTMNLKEGTNTIRITEINAVTNMDYIGFISDASLSLHQ